MVTLSSPLGTVGPSHNPSMFITLRDVKEPKHYSQRVRHGVPVVVICPLWCIMVAKVNAQRYYLHQASLKSEGKQRYDDDMIMILS